MMNFSCESILHIHAGIHSTEYYSVLSWPMSYWIANITRPQLQTVSAKPSQLVLHLNNSQTTFPSNWILAVWFI